MGYGAPTRSYYALGFESASSTGNEAAAESDGATDCETDADNNHGFPAGRAAGTGEIAEADDLALSNFDDVNGLPGFTAQAVGVISPEFPTAAAGNSWTINSEKRLEQNVVGY